MNQLDHLMFRFNSARKWLTMIRPPSVACLAFLILLSSSVSYGYSVLTHEAIVDSVWDASIKKVLLSRFPEATPEELEQAHAYAYGGCIIQDIGYYPFSSRLFSDLTHYVRSGDFIVALVRDSQDLNEYAFALGALGHYAADSNGHRIATNLAVAMLYPQLRRKFGKSVTYWDNPLSHGRTEFGFDVLQVAQGRYATDRYRAFIGFQVSKPVLERAFLDTYGMEMKDIFGDLSLAVATYRYTVGSILPGMTRVAWRLKKTELIQEIPGATQKKFLYNLSRSSYEKEWGTDYHKAGIRTRLVAWVIRIMPKSGPFNSLPFREPTPEIEKMFMASFNATVDNYRVLLAKVTADGIELPNENFDLGAPTVAGQYKGADLAYDKLLGKLAARQFDGISVDLRGNLLDYYKGRQPPASPPSKKENSDWIKQVEQLDQLRTHVAATP
jgi:hypothetical protein